jgi:hypothetical protein
MTAPTPAPAPTSAVMAASGPAKSPSPRRGLLRATLRVHRWALCFWLLLILAAAGALLWTYGPGIDGVQAALHSNACREPTKDYCEAAWDEGRFYSLLLIFGRGALVLLPVATAAWAGATLTGRELESGTAALAWTQSVSPARWLAAKLTVPAVLLGTGTMLLVLLHRLEWDRAHGLQMYMDGSSWFDQTVFPVNGPVVVARVLFGLAVGALAGLLARRTLPGLGASLVATGLVVLAADRWRQYLWPVKYYDWGSGRPFPVPGDPWYVGHGDLTFSGRHVPFDLDCRTLGDDAEVSDCLTRHGLSGHTWRSYHPRSDFWPLQLVETGALLLATALVVYTCFVVLRRRTA